MGDGFLALPWFARHIDVPSYLEAPSLEVVS